LRLVPYAKQCAGYIGACAEYRQAGRWILNDLRSSRTGSSRSQDNALAFEFRLQRIARLEVKFAPDTVGDNNLTFGWNLGLRGKTILPKTFQRTREAAGCSSPKSHLFQKQFDFVISRMV